MVTLNPNGEVVADALITFVCIDLKTQKRCRWRANCGRSWSSLSRANWPAGGDVPEAVLLPAGATSSPAACAPAAGQAHRAVPGEGAESCWNFPVGAAAYLTGLIAFGRQRAIAPPGSNRLLEPVLLHHRHHANLIAKIVAQAVGA